MEDLLKKFVYTGVGLVALTAERLQESIDELVGKGKISEEEGKKILTDFADSVDSRKEEIEGKFKSMAENVIANFNFSSKAEWTALSERLTSIESRLDSLEQQIKQ